MDKSTKHMTLFYNSNSTMPTMIVLVKIKKTISHGNDKSRRKRKRKRKIIFREDKRMRFVQAFSAYQ